MVTKSKITPQQLERMARILKVISHPVKLQVLQILQDEEKLDVSSLCNRLGMDCEISMMSHHLSKMKDNNILHSEKIGKQVFYSLSDRSILKLFACMEDSSFL